MRQCNGKVGRKEISVDRLTNCRVYCPIMLLHRIYVLQKLLLRYLGRLRDTARH